MLNATGAKKNINPLLSILGNEAAKSLTENHTSALFGVDKNLHDELWTERLKFTREVYGSPATDFALQAISVST